MSIDYPFKSGNDANFINDFSCPKCCLKYSMDEVYSTREVLECPYCGHVFEVVVIYTSPIFIVKEI